MLARQRLSARGLFITILVVVAFVLLFLIMATQRTSESVMFTEKTTQNLQHKSKVGSWVGEDCKVREIMSDFVQFPSLPVVQRKLARCQRIFYNRVPKCASRTILATLRSSANKSFINFVSEDRGMATNYFKNYSDLIAFPAKFMEYNTPLMYSRHLQFVNFTHLGYPMPLYFNVIRDPVERLISHYYYHFYGSYSSYHQHNHTNATTVEEAMSLDKCMDKRGTQCIKPFLDKVLPFFCGQNKACNWGWTSNSDTRFIKHVVRSHYMVVGMTEDLPGFMEVLEALLPHMFPNATQTFQKLGDLNLKKYKTLKKPQVSDKTRQVLKDILAKEYEFYNFIKLRFYNLLDRIRKAKDFERSKDEWTT